MNQILASIVGLLIAFLFMMLVLHRAGYKRKHTSHEPLMKNNEKEKKKCGACTDCTCDSTTS